MTHPAPAIAGVVSLVAIVGVIGALRLSPDAGTEKLVDNGSAAFEGTQEFRERFGDDAIVVLVKGNLERLLLTKQINTLLALEGCLAGNPGGGGQYDAEVCERIGELDATQVVFGPATFLNEAAARTNDAIQQQLAEVQAGTLSEEEFQQAVQGISLSGPDPIRPSRRRLDQHDQLRPDDRLRHRSGRRAAEGEVRLPVPVLGGGADLNPAEARPL